MEQKRCAGVLLHITSLPSKYGVGTLGKEAFDFIDFLKFASQRNRTTVFWHKNIFVEKFCASKDYVSNLCNLDLKKINLEHYLAK